jgi:hypothetical protein
MSDKKYEEWLELMKDTPKEELLKYHYNLLFKVDKQKEILDKINDYLINCIENDSTSIENTEVYEDVLEELDKLLEEIE